MAGVGMAGEPVGGEPLGGIPTIGEPLGGDPDPIAMIADMEVAGMMSQDVIFGEGRDSSLYNPSDFSSPKPRDSGCVQMARTHTEGILLLLLLWFMSEVTQRVRLQRRPY